MRRRNPVTWHTPRLHLAPVPLVVERIDSREASALVVAHHYLHRRPPISFAFGLVREGEVVGVCTFGTPASRQAQMSVCPTDPSAALELNRLWCHDDMPRNTESWFVSRCLDVLPPRVVFSYADTAHEHVGYIYRALSWRYAGWTDMDRKTPRYDYVPNNGGHSRDAFRPQGGGYTRVQRAPKAKYWTTTGNRTDKRRLALACGWPSLDWAITPVPTEKPRQAAEQVA